jgi:RND family efflux transporter MFP subunit
MFRMESVSVLRLTVAVPEAETSAVSEGTQVEFTARAWPGRQFKGTIARVAHSVDTRTRTMPIELDVDNADGALSAGMYVTVAWHVHRPEPTLFVPESTIVQSTEKTFVVRLRDGKADPVVVQRGAVSQGLVEVFGDLQAGDLVAKRGSEELKAGTPVVVRQEVRP